MRHPFALITFVLTFACQSMALAGTVEFSAADGLTITAETGGTGKGTVIVLFHMAKASRGEYRDIAPRLHQLGYRTLAVDQRSGGQFGGVRNETAKRYGRDPGFGAAAPDLRAAVHYARNDMRAPKVAVLGSSYSAALVIVLAGNDAQFADAVLSFSPGEYLRPKGSVSAAAANIQVTVFLTAARNEIGQITHIASKMQTKPSLFKPKGPGRHGASALLSVDKGEYWAALEAFLKGNVPLR